jgi:hypothetical protein
MPDVLALHMHRDEIQHLNGGNPARWVQRGTIPFRPSPNCGIRHVKTRGEFP